MSDETALKIYNHFLSEVLPEFRNSVFLSRYYGNEASKTHVNPLVRLGAKVFSQFDEDGITFEILRRMSLANGVFAEFGVGNGTENNTLALAAAGWNGFWVGGEDLAFDHNPLHSPDPNFSYNKQWITRENILELYQDGLSTIRRDKCDVISLDLDGNDFYIAQTLLDNSIKPEVFIVEYNGKFIPPIHFVIDYDPTHVWKGDDYHGASLASLCELFEEHGYFLACCNLSGANAFFVSAKWQSRFSDVPTEIQNLYETPKFWMIKYLSSGHPVSTKTLSNVFRKLNCLSPSL